MSNTQASIGFVSLGCPKALVDSEHILSQLRAEGYAIVPQYEEADLVVVNTCGFINAAVEESLDAIGEALQEQGKVIVTGCLGERPETIQARHPEVLAITGEADVEGVLGHVREFLPLEQGPFTSLVPQNVKLTPKHYSYVKIAEGCNHSCSFCIIPQLRGLQRSRDSSDILYEAARLVGSGSKELLLIAQDLSAYGVDIRYRNSAYQDREVAAKLYPLVETMSDLGAWVRLHYVYPYPHVRSLIPLMAEGKILPYLDIPLQHASPKILKAMRRPGGASAHLDTIREWRSICPDLAIRSTFIVGFPGESEEDFEVLLDFLGEAQLDRVGAFSYSEVDGAIANNLGDKVPEELKQERLERFMNLQEQISTDKLQKRVGQELEVVVDDYGELPGELIGRSKYDAPDIDGKVYATGNGTVKIGDRVLVKVEQADAHDLYGEVIKEVPWKANIPMWR